MNDSPPAYSGLTNREYLATQTMIALVTSGGDYSSADDLVSDAVMYADALIAKLAHKESE